MKKIFLILILLAPQVQAKTMARYFMITPAYKAMDKVFKVNSYHSPFVVKKATQECHYAKDYSWQVIRIVFNESLNKKVTTLSKSVKGCTEITASYYSLKVNQ